MYQEWYLCSPNPDDLAQLLTVAKRCGFPGMLGSIDCSHWAWKNFPMAWVVQYTGKSKYHTVILEVVAVHDLWTWHTFFGLPGALNNINIFDQSNLFTQILNEQAPKINFHFNGKEYHLGYYLADGIYPKYPTLIQTISNPIGEKNKVRSALSFISVCIGLIKLNCFFFPALKYFVKMQEAYFKDVEWTFGVLQAQFAIIQTPGRLWSQ
jgi:hypothetical protein